ncbi:MAG TPA: sigma factor-like helix-turn-helix DNA-binding protein [Candidatus Avimonas sp.]|jgi:predicted DNA-binding protein YlxM (UPF0122 family)|nr:sigma factor-like helix-turn-helix DNA-binding protein [Candidatus Avimonas sp.]HQA16636.1 sigma factor-like helix-turn-helix DNA-binding protein [Candidatus Avimonas sp.]HQD38704.1 sigma factor-like helix-turn-helix DNA-binding protein [Candidatus Avimonas sp.]
MAKNLEISLLFDFYGDMLTEKQQNMIQYYYNEDLSLAEIAENEGITRQGVRDSIKRAETQLVEMEERLEFARRFNEIRAGVERIRHAAHDIKEYNSRIGYSNEIDEKASLILEVSRRLSEI